MALQLAPQTSKTVVARRDAVNGTSFGVNVNNGAVITDSVVTTTAGVAVQTLSTGTAENVTAIGTGPGSVAFEAIAVGLPVNAAGELTVRNSIARAVATDVKADPTPSPCIFPPCAPGLVHVDHSDFVTTSGTIDDRGGNASADPLFAGAADYHLQRSSPAIDRGTADANIGLTDLDGAKRVFGAGPDMGAFEFQGGAPVVSTGAVTSVGPTSATLNGTVDPGDLVTTAAFDYGTTTAYGTRAQLRKTS